MEKEVQNLKQVLASYKSKIEKYKQKDQFSDAKFQKSTIFT